MRQWFDDLGLKTCLGVSKRISVSPQQTSGLILSDYFRNIPQELYSVQESEMKAKHSYTLDHVHESRVGVSIFVNRHSLD